MTYRHLSTSEQVEFLTGRSHDLEVQHWRSTVAALEADADPASDPDVATAHRKDLESLDARLGVLANLTEQLAEHPATLEA